MVKMRGHHNQKGLIMAMPKGFKHSSETRKKLSEARKGKALSAEHRKKLSEAQRGKTLSAETRKKLSEANKGKTLSAETRKKLSDAHKGKTLSAEHCKKMHDSQIGVPATGRMTKGIPGHCKAHHWVISSPRGERFDIDNLMEWCRTNAYRFTEPSTTPRKLPLWERAHSGLVSRRQWGGWQVLRVSDNQAINKDKLCTDI
jgi:hypothetical protein